MKVLVDYHNCYFTWKRAAASSGAVEVPNTAVALWNVDDELLPEDRKRTKYKLLRETLQQQEWLQFQPRSTIIKELGNLIMIFSEQYSEAFQDGKMELAASVHDCLVGAGRLRQLLLRAEIESS